MFEEALEWFKFEDESMTEGYLAEDCDTGWVGFVDKHERADDNNECLEC